MIEVLEQHVRECWQGLAPGRPQPRRLHFLKLSWDKPAATAALVLVAFPDRAATPVAVAKVARVVEGGGAIEAEAQALESLRGVLPAALAAALPRLVRRGDMNGCAFFLTSALPGELELHHTWGARRAAARRARMTSALRWALELGRAARTSASARGWEDAALGAVEPRFRELWNRAWPAGPAHGDFFPGNVLFRGDAVAGVVDWRYAKLRAPLFADVLGYELSFLLHAVAAGHPALAAERAALHALPACAAARSALGELGIDAGLTSDARLAVILAALLVPGAERERTRDVAARLLRLELGG